MEARQMPSAKQMKAQELKWRAEEDAHTLSRVREIMSDPKRYERAKQAAKGMVKEEERRAKEQAKRTAGLRALADSKPLISQADIARQLAKKRGKG